MERSRSRSRSRSSRPSVGLLATRLENSSVELQNAGFHHKALEQRASAEWLRKLAAPRGEEREKRDEREQAYAPRWGFRSIGPQAF